MCESELETEHNCNILTPHSIDHNSVSFPFSWVAQPGAWEPSLSGCWFSLPHLISNSSDLQTDWISCALSYIIVQRPPSSCGRHKSHSFNPSTVKVIISWDFSTGCSCYLHRCISYFDSPAGSGVNIQHMFTWVSKLIGFCISCLVCRHSSDEVGLVG